MLEVNLLPHLTILAAQSKAVSYLQRLRDRELLLHAVAVSADSAIVRSSLSNPYMDMST